MQKNKPSAAGKQKRATTVFKALNGFLYPNYTIKMMIGELITMKTTNNERLHILLANLDQDSNIEYINALAEQIADNQDHVSRLSEKANDVSSLNMLKHELDRLSSRNEVLLNMIFKLLEEADSTRQKSVELVFAMLKEVSD